MDRVYAETKAGVVITKFFAQHTATKEYFNSQAHDKIEQARVSYYPGDGVNVTTATDYAEQIKDYLPIGYLFDEEIISKVYCLPDGDPEAAQCVPTPGTDGSCCSDEFTGIYVVSFREIPSRWINKVTQLPNADVMAYMAKTKGYGKNFGYTVMVEDKLVLSGGKMVQEYDETGEKVGEPKFEYQPIFKAVQDDEDFAKCLGDDKHCLYAIQQIYG